MLILERKSRKVVVSRLLQNRVDSRPPKTIRLHRSCDDKDNTTMGDYKTYLAANILSEDKIVSIP
jgi:hypothetical protein